MSPNGILPVAKFTLRPSLAFSYIGSVTARHSSSVRCPNFAAWYKEWNYETFAPPHFQQRALPIFRRRPSRRAEAHILVFSSFALSVVPNKFSLFMVALWNRETIYIFMLWFVMVALCNRADHYIFILFLLLSSSSFFPRLISAVGDWMFTILWHMVWP